MYSNLQWFWSSSKIVLLNLKLQLFTHYPKGHHEIVARELLEQSSMALIVGRFRVAKNGCNNVCDAVAMLQLLPLNWK